MTSFNTVSMVLFSLLLGLPSALAGSQLLRNAQRAEKEGMSDYYQALKKKGKLSPQEAKSLEQTYIEKPANETTRVMLKEEQDRRQAATALGRKQAEEDLAKLARENAEALAKTKNMSKEELAKWKPTPDEAGSHSKRPATKGPSKKSKPEKDFEVDTSPPIDGSGMATEIEFERPAK